MGFEVIEFIDFTPPEGETAVLLQKSEKNVTKWVLKLVIIP